MPINIVITGYTAEIRLASEALVMLTAIFSRA
jgi:hypothetical protein